MAASTDSALVVATICAHGQAEQQVRVNQSSVAGKQDDIDTAAFSYGYTAKHDHGDLQPQLSNQYTALVQALSEAKQETEALMQHLVAVEKTQDEAQPPLDKKSRKE